MKASEDAALAKSIRQVNKLSEILADLETKYVQRQVLYLNAVDQLNTLEEENNMLKEKFGL